MNTRDHPLITVRGGELSQEEQQAYLKIARANHPDKIINSLTLAIDGDYIDIEYNWKSVPMERIRRISGYLAPTTRTNEAKTAEIADRVKHGQEE